MMVKYHEPVNLGNPDEFTMYQLANVIGGHVGGQLEFTLLDIPADDPKRRKPSISVAVELVCWSPSVGLSDGIAETVKQILCTNKDT